MAEGGRISQPNRNLLPLLKSKLPSAPAALLASRSIFVSGQYASITAASDIGAPSLAPPPSPPLRIPPFPAVVFEALDYTQSIDSAGSRILDI
jgi:hypothetical protein